MTKDTKENGDGSPKKIDRGTKENGHCQGGNSRRQERRQDALKEKIKKTNVAAEKRVQENKPK